MCSEILKQIKWKWRRWEKTLLSFSMICDSLLLEEKTAQKIHMISWCRIELNWLDKHISRILVLFVGWLVWCLSNEHDIAYYMRIIIQRIHIHPYILYIYRRVAKAMAIANKIQIIFLPPLWFHYHKILSIKNTHIHTQMEGERKRSEPVVKHRREKISWKKL